jgi:hypothetical protein
VLEPVQSAKMLRADGVKQPGGCPAAVRLDKKTLTADMAGKGRSVLDQDFLLGGFYVCCVQRFDNGIDFNERG